MSSFYYAKIDTYCECIINEMKSLAVIAVPDREIEKAIKIIESYDLKHEVITLCNNWKSLYIYKHEYLKEIIKELPDKPRTIFEHWILGKAFGYSDSSIGKFLKSTL